MKYRVWIMAVVGWLSGALAADAQQLSVKTNLLPCWYEWLVLNRVER